MALLSPPPASRRNAARRQRLGWLDVARGVALVAMIVYHGSFDLMFFGIVDWPVTSAPAWRGFAAAIAGTFLFLVGVSLVAAHPARIRWGSFWRRFAIIVAAAAVVTVGTYFAMPVPITFGILHAIATFSVLALPFLFAPAWLTGLAAVVVFVLPFVFRSAIFEAAWLVPFGLAPVAPITFDYEPIFPWFALTLAGIATARTMDLAGGPAPAGTGWLALMGRNSLLIYLVHQPILFTLVMFAAQQF
nr:heparan-alpha-glucosaminide N-acetyltransferase [Acuticoccus mangrovi]